MTNVTTDDAIDAAKDDDENNSAATEDSPSAMAEEDSTEQPDDAVTASAADDDQRVTTDVIQQLSTSLTDATWMKLASQLQFQQDDISYFESENSTSTARATNMLTIWTVSDFTIFSNFLAVLFSALAWQLLWRLCPVSVTFMAVCVSVTLMCCAQMTESIIMRVYQIVAQPF